MRPIRVAFCIDNMGVGGTEMNALRTAIALERERFDVRVLCLRPEGPLVQRYADAEIPVVPLRIRNLYGPGTLRRGVELARWLARERIDVLHAHDRYSNMFATPWARLAGTPLVVTSKRWGRTRPIHALGNRVAYRLSHRVLANSAAVARDLETADGVPRERVVVVPNFLDDASFDAIAPGVRAAMLAALGVPAGALVVGVVASLRPIKDHATLLRAVARLAPAWPALHLVLVGEGDERPRLEALAASLGIAARLHFAGLRPHLPNLHGLFDVSALTSTSEGFPNSVIEAMAAGRPVVASDVGGIPDAVAPGETGRLVPPGDPAALASAIGALLESPESRRRLGEAGRARARRDYARDTVLARLAALYEERAGR